MIILKKFNIFLKEGNWDITNLVVNKIVRFLSNDDINPIGFSSRKHILDEPYTVYSDFNDLLSILNESNLFRTNLVIIHIEQFHGFKKLEKLINKLKELGDRKFIIITGYKEIEDFLSNEDYEIYKTSRKITPNHPSKFNYNISYNLTDKNNNNLDLNELKKSYIRNKKIDSVFDDDDDLNE